MLKTETPSSDHAQLDQYATADLVNTLIDDQAAAVRAVRQAAPRIAAAVTAALPRCAAGRARQR
jgi:N-acetylmuramic acid 6-phosphate etherase